MITFDRLKALSFAHSAVYLTLLTVWLAPGAHTLEQVFGWGHGLGWIGMSLMCVEAVRRHVIPLWLGALVVVVGGIGPFAGTAGFVQENRRKRQGNHGMVSGDL